jgi:hypothetical protein
LRVVNDAEKRTLLGRFGHQSEHCQTDEEWIRGLARPQAEGGRKCVSLRRRQAFIQIEDGRAQALKCSERELHFPLGSDGAGRSEVWSNLDGVLEQCRLANAGFAAEHQYATASASRFFEDALEDLAFALAANQLPSRRPAVHPGDYVMVVCGLD